MPLACETKACILEQFRMARPTHWKYLSFFDSHDPTNWNVSIIELVEMRYCSEVLVGSDKNTE